MLKKWTLGIILLTTSLFSQAGLITSIITGADMEGIEVTAFFNNGESDTQIWSATSSTAGGVNSGTWSLNVDGNTFGDFDSSTNTFFGEWTLSNLSDVRDIVRLSVNASVANVYFDILEGFNPSTVGSNAGRPFVSSAGSDVAAIFSDVYSSPDLFGTMNIAWAVDKKLSQGENLVFLTDTDKVEVPEPSTLFMFAISLFALRNSHRKFSGK